MLVSLGRVWQLLLRAPHVIRKCSQGKELFDWDWRSGVKGSFRTALICGECSSRIRVLRAEALKDWCICVVPYLLSCPPETKEEGPLPVWGKVVPPSSYVFICLLGPCAQLILGLRISCI